MVIVKVIFSNIRIKNIRTLNIATVAMCLYYDFDNINYSLTL